MSAPGSVEERLARLEAIITDLQEVVTPLREEHRMMVAALHIVPADTEFTIGDLGEYFKAQKLEMPCSAKRLGRLFLRHQGKEFDGMTVTSVRHDRQHVWVVHKR